MSAVDAVNQPVRRSRTELHSGDVEIAQKPLISTREDMADEIVISADVLKQEYAEALAFNEEPVTVRIERSSEKFAPKVVDIWCNGKGAEILMNGKWVETRVLPVGMPVTTKRKYVEILARSKHESVRTISDKIDAHSERNDVERSLSQRAPFSIIRDDNPKGAAWATGIISFG